MAPVHAPVTPPKPHGCNKCTRSFATDAALMAHRRDTGHVLPCAILGCKRTFCSRAALQAHASSAAHITPAPAANNPPIRTDTVAAVPGVERTTETQTQNVQPLRCTKSGCKKTFQTPKARNQHLMSAAHVNSSQQKSQNMETQNKSTTKSPAKGPAEAAIAEAARPTKLQGTNSMPEKLVKIQQTTTVVHPQVQSLHNAARRTEPSSGTKPTQKTVSGTRQTSQTLSSTLSTSTRSSASALYPTPLHSRWLMIPTVYHALAMTALKARVSMAMTKPNKKDKVSSPHKSFVHTPVRKPGVSKRLAVALDCEMVRIGHNVSELARLSVIDYLTSEILIDTLVEPLNKVTDWRTQWSGITIESMRAAVLSGTALKGSPVARARLFDIIDEQTVIVGHALHHDFVALGIQHRNVVDSAILAQKAVGFGARKQWALRVLCSEFLGITIQDHGNQGHDSVEDAFAAREVVLWCLQNPEKLKAWGKKKKLEMLEEDRIRKAKKDAKRQTVASRLVYYEYEDDDSLFDDDGEILYLSTKELNELCHYPEWYDNWSD